MDVMAIMKKLKIRKLKKKIDWTNNVPQHIAIMMDGNGRWATRRGLPRTAGHYAGMQTMKETIRHCKECNIKYVTLYAFSTENWKRPQDEVDTIIRLVNEFVNDDTIREMNSNNIQVRFIGDIGRFSEETQRIMKQAAASTRSNDGMIVNFAMNYGGRNEIVQAIQSFLSDDERKELTEEEFEQYLYTAGCPSPELIIRTSGEKRISGFLLWQSAQAEIWFTNEMWPSFDRYGLYEAILEYQRRKCRAAR